MPAHPQLLIVEDDEAQRERLHYIVGNPPTHWHDDAPLPSFHIETAGCAAEARVKMQQAVDANRNFDVVLLDLGIPEDTHGMEEESVGLGLLSEIRVQGPDVSVVIVTAKTKKENVIHCLQHGAVDFICKPLLNLEQERQLFIRLMKATGVAREKALTRLEQTHMMRQLNIRPKKMRDELAQKVTGATHLLLRDLEKITRLITQRYGLDPQADSEDTLVLELARARGAAEELLRSVWVGSPGGETAVLLPSVDVALVAIEEAARIRPCFFKDSVGFQTNIDPGLRTTTIESDLRDLVVEMLFGVLKASPRGVELSARYLEGRKDIQIEVVYQGQAVARETVDRLAAGAEIFSNSPLDQSFDLLWYVARNLGVRLEAGEAGGTAFIRLLLPVIG